MAWRSETTRAQDSYRVRVADLCRRGARELRACADAVPDGEHRQWFTTLAELLEQEEAELRRPRLVPVN